MKLTLKVIFCFTLLLACAYSLAAQDGQKESAKKSNVSSKYNKSKNQTTVTLKPMALTGLQEEQPQLQTIPKHQMDLDVFFTYAGEQIAAPVENVTLRFRATENNYFFLRGQPVSVVLDEKVEGAQGRLLKLGETDYKSNLKFNSVYEETMTVSVPASAIMKIAEAKTATIYVGASGYTLKDKQLADLRDMASRLKP